jgi:hypothetical protein
MANKSSWLDLMMASAMALGLGTLLSIGAVCGINHYLGPEEDPFVPYTSSIHNSPDPD